jgi:hypothetical protein
LTLLAAALTTAIVVAVLTWLVLPPAEMGDEREQPSTFFNTPYGTKAAYQVLEKLGHNVGRLRRPIDTDTLEGLDAVVLLQPIRCLSEYEAEVLRHWIGEGNRLLVSPPAAESPYPDEECSGPHAWFRYAEVEERSDTLPSNIRLPIDVADLVADGPIRFDSERPLSWPSEDLPFHVLWEDEFGVVAFETSFGDGVIIALADVYGLTNRGLGEDDHAVWLASLAATLTENDPDAPLAFDEYHAGFPYRSDPWLAVARLLWDERWAWAVTQALLVAVLALIGTGARFGRAERVAPMRRRTQGEFTRAAGRFLHAARAQDLATSTLADYYRKRLARALHLPPRTSGADLVEVLRRRGWPQWADLVLRAAAQQGAMGETELVQDTQRMEAMLEALEHGAGKDDGTRAEHTHRVG